MWCDTTMTKLAKTGKFRDRFSPVRPFLTDSSTNFTMKPYFGPSRALVAGDHLDS
jgi:hypothetical protein